MKNNINLLLDFLLSPVKLTGELLPSLSGFFAVSLFSLSVSSLTLSGRILNFTSNNSVFFDLPLIISWNLVIAFLFLSLLTVWTHFMADLFNKTGGTRNIFKIFCLASSPLLLTLPFGLLYVIFFSDFLLLYTVVSFFIFSYMLYLAYLGIKKYCGLTTGQLYITFLTPFFIAPLIFLAVFVLPAIVIFSRLF